MSTQLLERKPHRAPQGHPFIGDLTLPRARAHEFCGTARRTLALMLATQIQGPIFWIVSPWETDALCGDGVQHLINLGRVTFVRPKRAEDLLWCTEEVLRTGAVPLVITELPEAPPLTPVRRLHLAAEAGAEAGNAPLSILLTYGEGGAQGVESRWFMSPTHQTDGQQWRLERRRARIAPPATWAVKMQKGVPSLHVGV
jgi:protein ImuA